MRVGSITKVFTTTMMMQLRDAGRLQLDDPVEKHLPGFTIQSPFPGARPITLRQLASHTAGLPVEAPLESFPHHGVSIRRGNGCQPQPIGAGLYADHPGPLLERRHGGAGARIGARRRRPIHVVCHRVRPAAARDVAQRLRCHPGECPPGDPLPPTPGRSAWDPRDVSSRDWRVGAVRAPVFHRAGHLPFHLPAVLRRNG